MSDERIALEGQTNFERNGVPGFMHRTRVEVAPGKVETVVEGFGPGCRPHAPVTSDHPAVERYVRDVDQAIQVTAYRNRHVAPIPKERPRRSRKAAPALCLDCGNRPHEVEICATCDGSGLAHSSSS